ncbi:hypothetical protein ALQ74_200121 [Pseudomonas savastanoi pv. glycinea]|uniref:Uncharacterized protein n=1 Tax=Pseudomonas savastanoi pv. glycinea TaxID=318 RepID=A0A3M3FGR9_PSESG|nr:hypothetical protein ALQ74_200121 [Pseudomonas savastanoi pv. glycinea]
MMPKFLKRKWVKQAIMSLWSKRDDYCGKCSQILTTISEGLTYSACAK